MYQGRYIFPTTEPRSPLSGVGGGPSLPQGRIKVGRIHLGKILLIYLSTFIRNDFLANLGINYNFTD